jgi:hypothetical protein
VRATDNWSGSCAVTLAEGAVVQSHASFLLEKHKIDPPQKSNRQHTSIKIGLMIMYLTLTNVQLPLQSVG